MVFEKYQLNIPSTEEKTYIVERFIEEICDRFNISNTFFGNISIALMEAVQNAIIHGNGSNKKKKVVIRFESAPGELRFTVSDEGHGFDYDHIVDPTDITIESDGTAGRGIFMMKALSDKIMFDKHGSQVTMVFNIRGIEKHKQDGREKELKKYESSKKKINQ